MRILFLVFALLFSLNISAQEAEKAPCTDTAYAALDFWIGEWDVYGEDTSLISTCIIEKRLNNCVIFGDWKFIDGDYATQITCHYDNETRNWHWYSVDNQGANYFFTKSERTPDKIVFYTQNFSSKDSASLNRKVVIKHLKSGKIEQKGSILIPSDYMRFMIEAGYKLDKFEKNGNKDEFWYTEYKLLYKRRDLNVPDEKLRAELGADDYGMRQYVMAFLKRGPNRDRSDEERAKLQKAHMDNIGHMAEAGDLIVAGPFLDDGDIRGIYIFNVKTVEEARKLTETDPAIQAGSLIMELHPWYGSAALMKLAEFEGRLQKKGF